MFKSLFGFKILIYLIVWIIAYKLYQLTVLIMFYMHIHVILIYL